MQDGVIRVTPVKTNGQFQVDWSPGPPHSPSAGPGAGDIRRWSSKTTGTLGQLAAYFASPDASDAELEQLGVKLTDFLLGGAAGAARAQAQAASPALRTWLDLPAKLAAVPWELMRDKFGTCLFCNPTAPWVRWQPSGISPPLRPGGWPIRVLVVVTADFDELPAAAVEVEAIEDILWQRRHDFDLQVLYQVLDPQQLREEIRNRFSPHILHVIGHGSVVQGKLAIQFPGTGAGTIDWRPSDIVADFGDGSTLPVPHLVLLNCCRGGPAVDEQVPLSEHGIWSIAGAFLHCGVDTVVGMQGDILDQAAGRFSRDFYEQLAQGKQLDEAVAHARNEVRAGPAMLRQFPLPVLQASRIRSDCLLPIPRPADIQQRLATTVEFAYVGNRFVDRELQRRDILQRVGPECAPAERSSLIVVKGPELSGKRFLATAILELLASRGCEVRRLAVQGRVETNHRLRQHETGVPVASSGPVSVAWTDVLVELRCGRRPSATAACSWLEEALPSAAFREFDYELEELCRHPHQAPPQYPGESAVVGDARDAAWPAPGALTDHFIERVFRSFRTALGKAAQAAPLVLVFDELTNYSTHLAHAMPGGTRVEVPAWWPIFEVGLFAPVARGEVPNVTIILSMRDAEFEAFHPGRWDQKVRNVSLPEVAAPELHRLVRQLYRRLCPEHWCDPHLADEVHSQLAKSKSIGRPVSVMEMWRFLGAVFDVVKFVSGRAAPDNPFHGLKTEFES